jgi:hypothetical protein
MIQPIVTKSGLILYDSKEIQKELDKFLKLQLIKLTEQQNETK